MMRTRTPVRGLLRAAHSTRMCLIRPVPQRRFMEQPRPQEQPAREHVLSSEVGARAAMGPKSSLVLETLLDTSSDKRKLHRRDTSREIKPPALRILQREDPTTSPAWEREEADLVRLLEQVRDETRREREAEAERVRIREALQKGVRIEAKLQPRWHLTRVGPRPGTSEYPAITIAIPQRKAHTPPPSLKPSAAPSPLSPHQQQLQQQAQARSGTQAPSAWDSAERDEDDGENLAALPRARQLLAVIRSDVGMLFTYITAAKLRRMLAIESAHLTWIRFLLALLALLLIIPADSSISPSPETQRMLRLILLALLLMHTQQLLLRFSALNMQRRPMYFSSMASAASFALLWLIAVLFLPYATPRSTSTPAPATPAPTPTSVLAPAPTTSTP